MKIFTWQKKEENVNFYFVSFSCRFWTLLKKTFCACFRMRGSSSLSNFGMLLVSGSLIEPQQSTVVDDAVSSEKTTQKLLLLPVVVSPFLPILLSSILWKFQDNCRVTKQQHKKPKNSKHGRHRQQGTEWKKRKFSTKSNAIYREFT